MAALSWLLLLLAWILGRRKLEPLGRPGYRVEHLGLISGLGSFSLLALLLTGMIDSENPIFLIAIGAMLALILLLAASEYLYWRRS